MAALAVLAAVVALPHLRVHPPRPARAAELVRDVRMRELGAAFVERWRAPGADGVALGRAYADSMRAARERPFASVRVRTSWLSPLLARNTRYLVEVRERAGGPAEYYVIRGLFARRGTRTRWSLRLF